MRRNVLFIAKFDNVLKGMNALLAKTFNMQMCPPETIMVEKMLGVMEIDLILLYVSGLQARLLKELCGKLAYVSIHTPIVVFGTADECADFDSYCTFAVSKYMHRPLAIQDITRAVHELLEAEPKASSKIQPEAEQASSPAGRNMSLAALADALETDERRCILLVDDDGRILRAIKMLLDKTYRINLANSGMSALESIERERPDAVLLDYEMPMFNGKQTLEVIRQNEKTRDLPVFFLTGVADKERIKDVIHLKPQGYLLKSAEQSAIIDMLENYFTSVQEI